MLSIAKIHSARSQAKARSSAGYLRYLGRPAAPERGFEGYARGDGGGPQPFWAGAGLGHLGLAGPARPEQIERLARGFHPISGGALLRGAGDSHVMGLDLTFSAPKDVSAAFAGGDEQTREDILDCMRGATRAALSYAESVAVSRFGAAGCVKRFAKAAIAACFEHLASRAGQPQLHIHSLLFNAGLRESGEWGSLEQRGLFDRKLAIGALWRAELAHRLSSYGFEVIPDGAYFKLRGITDAQRVALSTRSREIDEYLAPEGLEGKAGAKARNAAARLSRKAKKEPGREELLESFSREAAGLGITPDSVRAMRAPRAREEALEVERSAEAAPVADHPTLLAELTASQSCASAHEALALICQRGMGRWGASRCLQELDSFLRHDDLIHLGRSENLAQVFTSRATKDLEARISREVEAGKGRGARVPREFVDREFDRLEGELREALGVGVSLAQQRAAALHACCDTGAHAFIEGWAGSGKTTALRAAARAWEAAGFEVRGVCQSASAALNLDAEAGIRSRTIASLLLSLRDGRSGLGSRTVLVLDEAGMVGSREFGLLQEAVVKAGAKLVAVGDSKQLQPIEAGGIFASLARAHGKAEISEIRRQRTDFEPMLAWLEARAGLGSPLDAARATALRSMPEDARGAALEAICARDPRLARAFGRWRERFDFQWLREAVELLARGEAPDALAALDARGRLRLAGSQAEAMKALIDDWERDKSALPAKAIIAATRADAAELNAMARARLIGSGAVQDALGADARIRRRDGSTEARRFAPGDRIAFLENDRELGVANGSTGQVTSIQRGLLGPCLTIRLDEPNAQGAREVTAPVGFAALDWGYAITNHRAQGRTFDTAHVLANPALCDREWAYVAMSRSRFATTLHADAGAFCAQDPESHLPVSEGVSRAARIGALASRMRRSRAKGTSLDFPNQSGAVLATADPDLTPGVPRGGALSAGAKSATILATRFMVSLRSRLRSRSRSRSRSRAFPLQAPPEPEAHAR
jgi:conjugative relaxase-like TrwC/TraI family protein